MGGGSVLSCSVLPPKHVFFGVFLVWFCLFLCVLLKTVLQKVFMVTMTETSLSEETNPFIVLQSLLKNCGTSII